MKSKAQRGQAVIEYVLLIGVIAGLTMGYIKFYGKELLASGLAQLQAKAQACMSHPTSGTGATQCTDEGL